MRARVRAIVGARVVTRGVPALVAVFLVAAAWPSVGAPIVVIAIATIAGDAVMIACRERRRLRLALLEAGAEGRGLADMLLAWNEAMESGRSQTKMGAWLADYLGREFASLPVGVERSWVRKGIGAVRYLVPVAVAMLLFWWLRPDVAMPWFGLGGGAVEQAQNGGQGNGAGEASLGNGQPVPHPGEPPTSSPPPSQQPDRPPEGPVPQQPSPAPFLDVPPSAQIVVPEFTRDGPTRRAMAHQAMVGVEQGGGAAASRRASGGAGDQELATPQAARERFLRAAEKALQSRRVPERDRAIVKSFFDELSGTDK